MENTIEKLENSIGNQIGFLLHSGASVEDTIRRIKEAAIKYADTFQVKAESWDKLDEEISKYYNNEDLAEDAEDDMDGLVGIGEIAAIAFGYL